MNGVHPALSRKLLQDNRYAPAWIAAILRRVAGPEGK